MLVKEGQFHKILLNIQALEKNPVKWFLSMFSFFFQFNFNSLYYTNSQALNRKVLQYVKKHI